MLCALFRDRKHLYRRLLVYMVGLFLIAFAVSLSARSDLGVSPVSAPIVVLSTLFHWDLGAMTVVVYCIYVLAQVALLGQNFRPWQLLQVVAAGVFGRFVSLTGQLLSAFRAGNLAMGLGVEAVSSLLLACGILLYLAVDFIPQPDDGLLETISTKYHCRLSNVKNIFDLSNLLIAAVLSFAMFHRLVGVGAGTVVLAFLTGRILAALEHFASRPLNRFLGIADGKHP